MLMNNGWTVALLIFQFALTMLFYPLRVGANGHVSLAHDKIDVNLRLFGLAVAKVRIKQADSKYELTVNGKPLKPKKKVSAKSVISVIERYRIEQIKIKGNLLALVGTNDARTTALLCAGIMGALRPLIKNLNIYTAEPSDTLEVDGRLRIKITVLQLINLIVAGLRG